MLHNGYATRAVGISLQSATVEATALTFVTSVTIYLRAGDSPRRYAVVAILGEFTSWGGIALRNGILPTANH